MDTPKSHLAEDLFGYWDDITAQFITDGAEALAVDLQHTGKILMALCVAMWGFAMLRGLVKEPVMESAFRLLKMSFIFSFATNSALYSSYFVDLLNYWPEALHGKMSHTAPQKVTEIIDHIVDLGLNSAKQAGEGASFRHPIGYIVMCVMFCITLLVALAVSFVIISSKISLALLLSIGPMFIIMMLFDATKKFFEQWLGLCISFGFAIFLSGLMSILCLKYLSASLEATSTAAIANGGVVALGSTVGAVVAGIFTYFFMKNIGPIASGLGGGVSTATTEAGSWAYDNLKKAAGVSRDMGKAGYNAGKKVSGQFNRGQGNNQGNSIQNTPKNVYRRITKQRAAKSA